MKLGFMIGISMCLLGYLGAEGFFWPIQPVHDYFNPMLLLLAWLAPEQQNIEVLDLTTKRITLFTIASLGCSLFCFNRIKGKQRNRLLSWLMPFIVPCFAYNCLWLLVNNYTWY